MSDMIYFQNVNHNRTIALLILVTVLISYLNLLDLGTLLNKYTIGTWELSKLFITLGLAWVIYGIYKKRFGGG